MSSCAVPEIIREATKADYDALLSGEAPAGLRLAATEIAPHQILVMLAGVADDVRPGFSPTSWLIVDGDRLVGLCSIVKPPSDGVVELGYGIAPSERRHGYATKAVAAIAVWARSRPDVTALAAETSPTNAPSQAVLSVNGFQRVGERIDEEDGLVYCWRLDT